MIIYILNLYLMSSAEQDLNECCYIPLSRERLEFIFLQSLVSWLVSNLVRSHHFQYKPARKRKTYSSPREQDELRMDSNIKENPTQAFKSYMEQHVEKTLKDSEDREKRRMQLEQEMIKFGLDEKNSDLYRKVLANKETNHIRQKRAKITKSDFKKIKTIGLGAFGEVSLVRKVKGATNHINGNQEQMFAMKTLKKSEVIMRNQVAHVKAERDILAEADNDWIVKLFHSFQVRSYFWSKTRL